MSVAALQVYDFLLGRGFKDADARAVAEFAEAKLVRNRQEAEEYTDKAVAASEEKTKQAVAVVEEKTKQAVAVVEEKSDAKFVTKEQMGETLTRGEFREETARGRDETAELRREMIAGFAAQHAEIHRINRHFGWLIATLVGVGVGLMGVGITGIALILGAIGGG